METIWHEEMSVDEKLKEIDNLIENLLKVNGKFVTPDYSSVMFDYVDVIEACVYG